MAAVEPSLLTVWARAEEVLPLKLESPPLTAVIEWLPTASVVVAKVAWPVLLSVPVPSVVEPSLKVTELVGTPAPGATTPIVAEKVTDGGTVGVIREVKGVITE